MSVVRFRQSVKPVIGTFAARDVTLLLSELIPSLAATLPPASTSLEYLNNAQILFCYAELLFLCK